MFFGENCFFDSISQSKSSWEWETLVLHICFGIWMVQFQECKMSSKTLHHSAMAVKESEREHLKQVSTISAHQPYYL